MFARESSWRWCLIWRPSSKNKTSRGSSAIKEVLHKSLCSSPDNITHSLTSPVNILNLEINHSMACIAVTNLEISPMRAWDLINSGMQALAPGTGSKAIPIVHRLHKAQMNTIKTYRLLLFVDLLPKKRKGAQRSWQSTRGGCPRPVRIPT